MKKLSYAPILLSAFMVFPLTACGKKVTVTWKNDDGTVLEVDKDLKKGTLPTYDGATPTKAATAEYTYTFAGWDAEIVPTEEIDVIYTATYNATKNRYTVTFKNEDGTILDSAQYEYGQTPVYNGNDPQKAATAKYTYAFNGWNRQIAAVTGDQEYVATFTSTINKYTIKFVDYNDNELSSEEVEYDAVPTAPSNPSRDATSTEAYDFIGWDSEVTAVTGAATYKAQYFASPCEFVLVGEDHYEVKGLLDGDYAGEIEIPATWHGLPVTKIQSSAFYNKPITAVTLHDGLENIGNVSFYGTSIESVDIPGSVKIIGDNAFASCLKLRTVNFNEGLEQIGSSAFEYSKVEEIVIPSTVTNIFAYAFRYCYNLLKVDCFAADFTNLYGSALQYCYSLTEIILRECASTDADPSFITYAASSYALRIFYSDTYSEEAAGTFTIVQPDAENHKVGKYYYTTKIGSNEVKYLVGEFGIENDPYRMIEVTDCDRVKEYACSYHSSLYKVFIGKDVRVIHNFGFDYCSGVGEIEFELGGTETLEIGQSAFRGTTHAHELVIPYRCKNAFLNQYAFTGIQAVTSYRFENEDSTGFYRTKDGVLYENYGTSLWLYPSGKTDTSFTVPAECTALSQHNGIHNNYLTELHFAGKGAIKLWSYCLSGSNIEEITFDPESSPSLYWYPIAADKLATLVLPANTECRARAFGNLGTINPTKVFYEGTNINSWVTSGDEWFNNKGGYCSVYMYSADAAMDANDLPSHFSGSWRYVADVPTAW